MLGQIASRSCTPSTDARCTTAALTATFGQSEGVIAAWCTADFLVVAAKGMPNHPTSLGSIYTPPGGSCVNNATTCGYGDQARAGERTSSDLPCALSAP